MPDLRPTTGQQPKTAGEAARLTKEEPALKSTFVSVLLLAGFIAITWIGVFVLFVARN